jgi:hypothetical protein
MAQNIRDFYTAATTNDFARQFQFRLNTLANTNLAENQLVYLETANLPGRAITNIPVPFMGLQFNVPGTVTFPGSDAWAVSFRCDQDYDIRALLENATINTFDESTSTGDYNIARNSSRIILNLLGKDPNTTVRQYTLYGAYLVSVGESSYNLTDAGNIVTVPATLAYQYWSVTKVGSESVNPNLPTSSTTTNTNRWGT